MKYVYLYIVCLYIGRRHGEGGDSRCKHVGNTPVSAVGPFPRGSVVHVFFSTFPRGSVVHVFV